MLTKLILLALILATPTAWSRPLSVIPPDHPLAAELLSSRVAARAARLMQDSTGDPRFPFPNMQELAAIRKVAETLIMLGQEVIPSIIGEMPSDIASSMAPTEVPNDAVNNN